jgi:chemosensory pili system protein ChpC
MNMLAIQTGQATEVACVILPLRSVHLVVPAMCVAEVLPWRAPSPLAGAPRGCPGTLNWHGATIPAIDHELLESTDAAGHGPFAGRCLAVLNRVTPDAAWPFYALVVHGIPRLVQVAEVDIAPEQDAEVTGELLRIRVGTELLAIPDLVHLERQVARLLPPAS